MILYLIDKNIVHKKNINLLSKLSRQDFLNKTFCGQFINGNWKETISQDDIDEKNEFLKKQIKIWQNFHENLSCDQFIKINCFYKKSVTDIERNNPMGFTILIYKNLYQFQVLMRTLYTRTNYHCIHIDLKASSDIYKYALKLSNCLDNIYLSNQRLNISWGTFSLLQAERICQKILLEKSSKWFYYMTIAGSELPIETNRNRIEILQLSPDKNRIDVSSIPRQTTFKNLTIYKGEFHTILTRIFLQAIHNDSLSIEFWNFLNGSFVPDEYFYSTLVHFQHLPGIKSRMNKIYPYYQLLSHYKSWIHQPFSECQSEKTIEGVCQFNYKDLFNIEQSKKLFANKFNQDLDLISIFCWEQWINIKQNDYLHIDNKHYLNKFPFTTINSTDNSTLSKDFYHMLKYLNKQN
ncbi:unnamed protein product [Adineta steineri]|uniref:Uncharacterized protein n=1 Tax=Adineta steineri TaxID=433720 RepID=A0A813TW55_9BILA|nr:unnamed protein product [Adineta steineri]